VIDPLPSRTRRGNESYVLVDSYVLQRRQLPPLVVLGTLDDRGGV